MTLGLLVLAALLMSTLAPLAACSGSSSPASHETGCGSCEREVADLRAQLQSLNGVTAVKTVQLIAASPTDASGVDIELRSSRASDAGLSGEAARIVWRSRTGPVEVVNVSIRLVDGSMAPTLPYDFRDTGRDYASYVDQWGARPVE